MKLKCLILILIIYIKVSTNQKILEPQDVAWQIREIVKKSDTQELLKINIAEFLEQSKSTAIAIREPCTRLFLYKKLGIILMGTIFKLIDFAFTIAVLYKTFTIIWANISPTVTDYIINRLYGIWNSIKNALITTAKDVAIKTVTGWYLGQFLIAVATWIFDLSINITSTLIGTTAGILTGVIVLTALSLTSIATFIAKGLTGFINLTYTFFKELTLVQIGDAFSNFGKGIWNGINTFVWGIGEGFKLTWIGIKSIGLGIASIDLRTVATSIGYWIVEIGKGIYNIGKFVVISSWSGVRYVGRGFRWGWGRTWSAARRSFANFNTNNFFGSQNFVDIMKTVNNATLPLIKPIVAIKPNEETYLQSLGSQMKKFVNDVNNVVKEVIPTTTTTPAPPPSPPPRRRSTGFWENVWNGIKLPFEAIVESVT